MFSTRASNHVIAGPSYEHANARGGGEDLPAGYTLYREELRGISRY